MDERTAISNAKEAADNELVLAFGLEAAGLVERVEDPGDRRGRLVRLTSRGEQTVVAAARVHVENIRRYFLEPLPAEDRQRFAEDLRILSHSARDVLPRLP